MRAGPIDRSAFIACKRREPCGGCFVSAGIAMACMQWWQCDGDLPNTPSTGDTNAQSQAGGCARAHGSSLRARVRTDCANIQHPERMTEPAADPCAGSLIMHDRHQKWREGRGFLPCKSQEWVVVWHLSVKPFLQKNTCDLQLRPFKNQGGKAMVISHSARMGYVPPMDAPLRFRMIQCAVFGCHPTGVGRLLKVVL